MLAVAVTLVVTIAAPIALASGELSPAAQDQPATTGDDVPQWPVLVGAGNIATCGDPRHEATAQLLDRVVEDHDATVFALGDNAYERGTLREYEECYDPTWGRHKERTRPALGNWEYGTPGAAGYFEYFGDRAGDPDKGYYSYILGDWHIVVLNTNCHHVGCNREAPQLRWLHAELQANRDKCTIAFGHHPRFSSSREVPSYAALEAMWAILDEGGVSAYVAGHSHHYERFAPQTSVGVGSEDGVRQFVVGTGGREAHLVGSPLANSEVISAFTYGVLKLTLRPDAYAWEFLSTADSDFTDSGEAACVAAREIQIGTIARTAVPVVILAVPILLFLIPILFRPPRYRVN
jgi:acid phosphatase type 7